VELDDVTIEQREVCRGIFIREADFLWPATRIETQVNVAHRNEESE